MKAVSARRRGALWQNILRGVLLSAAVTVLLVLVFALLISLFPLSDSVIHIVNQLIKLAAIFVGVRASVHPRDDRGLLRGALTGLLYMALGVTVYALLSGRTASPAGYAADLLMGVAAGGLMGLLRARSGM